MVFRDGLAVRILAPGLLLVVLLSLLHVRIYTGIRRDLLEARRTSVRRVVEAASETVTRLARQARSGDLPAAEARRRAAETVRSMRHGGGEGPWIVDLESRIVMHPGHAGLEGKPFADTAGLAEKSLFPAFVDICRAAGSGFVDSTRDPGPGPMISYAKLVPEWGWIVGSDLPVADSEREWRRLLLIGIGGTGAILVLFLVVSLRVGRGAVAGVSRLAAGARAMAEGDFHDRLPEEGPREIGDLAGALNALRERLRERIDEVIGQVRDAGACVEDLSSRVLPEGLAQDPGGDPPPAALADVTATVTELVQSSRRIRSNAESVRGAAEQTVEMAQQGTVLVQESVDTIARMQEQMSDIMRKNLFLAEKSREIDKVLDLIRGISRETRLLSLNAALEASIAGDIGLRFAAVATEVRRLSENARQSIDAVAAIISQVRTAVDDSVKASEQGLRDAERSREAIDLSAGAFSEIIEMIEKTSRASVEISSSVREQSSAEEELAERTRKTSEAIRSMESCVQGMAAAADGLRSRMEGLHRSVRLLRPENTGPESTA